MLARGSGASRFRLIVLMMLFCGVLSALISVNGAVAALLPVVVVLAVRLKRPPSQLLMPLVFGAHAGSMLALTGTPVNVLVYEASLDAGADGLRLLRVRLCRRLPRHRHHRSSRSCSARGSCRCARTARCRRTSAATPARSSSSSASTTACISSGCGRSRRWSASRAPGSTSADAAGRDPPDAAGGGGQRRGAARADRGGRPHGGARRRRGGGRARRRPGAEPGRRRGGEVRGRASSPPPPASPR